MLDEFDADAAVKRIWRDALMALWVGLAIGACIMLPIFCFDLDGSTAQYEYRVQGKANEFSQEYNQWCKLKSSVTGAHGRDENEKKQWARVERIFDELHAQVTSETENGSTAKR